MANRIFNQFPKTLQKEVCFLEAEATIGTAGAITGIKGSGISTITNVSGTGNFSITLEDKYSRFLFGSVSMLAESITAAAVVPSAAIANATDTFTLAGHGFLTGRKVQIATSNTLPTGLSATTDYFVIRTSSSAFKLATTLANAQAGTAINITDDGVGNQTVTPFAPFGSAVAHIEFTSTDNDALVVAGSAIPFSCYDYAGALVDPTPLSKIKVLLVLRNSSLVGKGE